MTDAPTALERLLEALKRARDAAPDCEPLMPQPRVPQDPRPVPKPFNELAEREDSNG